MVIAAGVHVFEPAGFMVGALCVRPIEEETFDFIGGVQSVVVLFVEIFGETFEDTPHVGRVGLATFVDNLAKNHDLAGTKDVGWAPVKSSPVNAQTQIAFPLR